MDPAFAATRRRLGDMTRELERLQMARELLAVIHSADFGHETKAWVVNAALSSGVTGLYTGMEEVLRGLLSAVDNYVPTGDRSHQDILDQASMAVEGTRPALISEGVYSVLTTLKGFRHFERHNYRFRFDDEQVERNERLAETLVPSFIADIEAFMAVLSAHPENDVAVPPGPR